MISKDASGPKMLAIFSLSKLRTGNITLDVNKVLTIEQIEKIKLIHKKESEKMKH